MEHLTKQTFLEKVFDFEKKSEWQFQGDKPCIIDFYADWCGPCKMVAPIMEELSKEYDGKVDIYKIDTDQEQEMASAFGIRSIPSVLFCPREGKPQMSIGAMPKEGYVQAIEQIFGIQKPLVVAQN
jgi:thioredoxin 1